MRGRSGFSRVFVRLLAVVGAVFALCGVFVPSAGADDGDLYLVSSCTAHGTLFQQSGEDWYSPIPMRDCPHPGLRLGLGVIGVRGHSYVWQYQTGATGAKIRDIVMHVAGGEWGGGLEYSLATCSDDNCEPLSILSPDNDGEWAVSGINSDEIWIRAICRQETCRPVDPPLEGSSEEDPIWGSNPSFLAVSDIRMVIEDSKPPGNWVELPSDWPAPSGQGGWLRPEISDAPFAISDDGSGIALADTVVRREGEPPESAVPLWTIDNRCRREEGYAYAQAVLCPTGASPPGGVVDLRGFADGHYIADAHATDAVGNSMEPMESHFGIDGTPPAPVTGLRALTVDETGVVRPINEFGWTDRPEVRLYWDDPFAKPQDGGSPLRTTHIDVNGVGSTTGQPPSINSLYTDAAFPITFGAEGRWRFWAWIDDMAGNKSNREPVDIGFDTDRPEPAQLKPIPWLSVERLRAGVSVDWDPSPVFPRLESGVCGYAVDVAEAPGHVPEARLDVRSPATSYRLAGDFAEGFHHFALRAVSCAGVGSDAVDTPLNVDGGAPSLRLDGVPAGGWSRDPVTAGISATDRLSGVAELSHSVDGQATVKTSRNSAEVTLGDGVHALSFGATDRAGNTAAAQTRVVSVDTTAPTAIFEPRAPESPAQINAIATDAVSGVESAWIELRAAGGGDADWRTLATTSTPGAAGAMKLAAELPDSLADGEYELRVVAGDGAGNFSESRRVRLSDSPMTATMPAREKVDLTAEIAEVTLERSARCSARRSARKPRACSNRELVHRRGAGPLMLVEFPGRAALVGELATRSGKPVSGADLEVRESLKGGGSERIAFTKTDRSGRYSLRLPPGPGRNYSVTYRGSPVFASSRGSARLRVRGEVNLKISPNHSRAGLHPVFSGSVGGARWQPDGGVRVEIQYFNGVRWAAAVDSVNTDDRGRFRIDYWSPGAVQSRSVYSFRAHVERAYGWPYESGNSKPVPLTVMP